MTDSEFKELAARQMHEDITHAKSIQETVHQDGVHTFYRLRLGKFQADVYDPKFSSSWMETYYGPDEKTSGHLWFRSIEDLKSIIALLQRAEQILETDKMTEDVGQTVIEVTVDSDCGILLDTTHFSAQILPHTHMPGVALSIVLSGGMSWQVGNAQRVDELIVLLQHARAKMGGA